MLLSQITDVAKELELPRHFNAVRRYDAVCWEFNHEHRDILVLSEIDLDGQALNNHCSLLSDVDEHHFKMWTPLIGETACELDLQANMWDVKACSGIVLLA